MLLSESHTMHFCISAQAREVDRLVSDFQDTAFFSGIDELKVFKISVCLAEALNNVVEHSEFTIPDKPIYVSCELHDEYIVMLINFPANKILINKGDLSDHRAIAGRGCLIMEGWLDELSYGYSEGINSIYMKKVIA